MLELDKTFIYLLINFLVLWGALHYLLFAPMLKIFREREDTVKGSLDKAKDMQRRKDEALLGMQKELQEARGKAKEAFEAMRNQGLDRQRDIMSKAASEAMLLSDKAKQELKAESQKARERLRADVERLSNEIMEKLIRV